LLVQNTQEAAVALGVGSDHNIVRDVEATDVGVGVAVHGQYNLVTGNYMHDLHMVRNTPGGTDDSGAVAVVLYGPHNEVSYNTMINCRAPSYDFGVDGGAVEWVGNVDNSYVHHNWANGDNGFLEVGGGSARNTVLAYIVSVNNGGFSYIHLTGQFASVVQNFRIENNTIVETASDGPHWVVFGFSADPTASTFLVRNNVLYIAGFSKVSNASSFTHDHNLYYLVGGTQLGFALGPEEKSADPLFVNLVGQDFHLQPSSPAMDAGIDRGYTLDFEDHPVPVGVAPDLGSYEYQGAP